MNYAFSNALKNAKPSFIREMLKMLANPNIISFGGGLPDEDFFPDEQIQQATASAFKKHGKKLYQYNSSEGYLPLRELLAERFSKQQGVQVDASQILIVSGSQQALDLLGKVFLDAGDVIATESPSYLGAIQAFKLFNPTIIELANDSKQTDGISLEALAECFANEKPKFFYGIPNFQNPTGISYSAEKREQIANILKANNGVMLEDDPYGSIRFTEAKPKSIYALAPNNVVYMNSFSKVFAPSFRLGWVVASEPIMEKLVIAKQATDLHTNFFVQAVLYEYLTMFDIDAHIAKITASYQHKRDVMIQAIKTHLPKEVEIFPNEGGMFLWIKIPQVNAFKLLDIAIKENVAFVPGETFSTLNQYSDQIRLNYTGQSVEQIVEGMKRLQLALAEYNKTS